jgi:hypothetical protein
VSGPPAAYTQRAEEVWHTLPVTFTHYGRGEYGENFAPKIAAPMTFELDRLFVDASGGVVFYGHSHVFSDDLGRGRYVNPGALGCDSGPHARYVVLEIERNGSFALSHRSASYNPTELLRQFEARDVPRRDFIMGTMFRQVIGR